MSTYIIANGELQHAGIKGMRWGVRRYQNDDGTLTEAGKKRYQSTNGKMSEFGKKRYAADKAKADLKKANTDLKNAKKQPIANKDGSISADEFERYSKSQKTKATTRRVLKTVGGVAVAGLTAAAVTYAIGKEVQDYLDFIEILGE